MKIEDYRLFAVHTTLRRNRIRVFIDVYEIGRRRNVFSLSMSMEGPPFSSWRSPVFAFDHGDLLRKMGYGDRGKLCLQRKVGVLFFFVNFSPFFELRKSMAYAGCGY